MKRLVFTGKRFEFRPEEKPDPVPQLGDMPKRKQIAGSNARVYRAVLGARKTRGTDYRPGPLLTLADDQCRFFISDKLMCGEKTSHITSSWCEAHHSIAYGRKSA